MLSERERSRYARQILLPEWTEAGQQKLKESKVLVAGAGGLGSAVLTYLTSAGVGELRIIDCDRVDLSNLNRQILHGDSDIGKRKIDSARERLQGLNQDIRIDAIGDTITEDNVFDLVADYPIVDAMDNLQARFLLNKVAAARALPLFHGAVHGFEGRVTTMLPGETACIRCLYRQVLPGTVPVPGVTPGIIGCIQATEVIKHILGIGKLLTNRLLTYDGLSLTFNEFKLKRDPACQQCGPMATGS